jgi:predicted nucleic acid-binding protein
LNFVLDASITLAWAFEDERDMRAMAVLDALEASEAATSTVWTLEVSNGLLTAERKNRISVPDASRFCRLLLELPIVVDPGDRRRTLDEVRRLARSRNLSAYDASYLDLALHLGVPLATLDERLERAARMVGVETFGAS